MLLAQITYRASDVGYLTLKKTPFLNRVNSENIIVNMGPKTYVKSNVTPARSMYYVMKQALIFWQ